ncbi:unnamed protein product [Callosobruchus maculatus]|uniref:Uncharacterized protein n=1 Tax=Callosobruchus maculatus TaxID=64391 RepID=A0A653CRE6_CALMS|nr:unnamed protein product [Callosobruchus maculatus]
MNCLQMMKIMKHGRKRKNEQKKEKLI